MDRLVREGKIRGWGSCNDNAFGLAMLSETARRLGTTPPCSSQNDFSVLNRRTEQDGLAEASRPQHANAGATPAPASAWRERSRSRSRARSGFMAYNALAGGVLTGKYLEVPAAVDDYAQNQDRARQQMVSPRGAPPRRGGARWGATARRRRRGSHKKGFSLLGAGRMDDLSWGGTLYRYRTRAAGEATRQYAAIARRAGIPLAELALRWAKDAPHVTTVRSFPRPACPSAYASPYRTDVCGAERCCSGPRRFRN